NNASESVTGLSGANAVGLTVGSTTTSEQQLLNPTTPNDFTYGTTVVQHHADYTQAVSAGTLTLNGLPCDAACVSGITMRSVLTEITPGEYAALVAGSAADGTTCPIHAGLNG